MWDNGLVAGGLTGEHVKGACGFRLLRTDPGTRVHTYDDLGCKTDAHCDPAAAVSHRRRTR